VGTNIVLWNSSATSLTATWRSGVIGTPPKVFKFGQVFARAYAGAVTLNLYGDGVLVWSETVDSSKPFKLPCDDKCIQWELEIVTTVEVYELILAESQADLVSAGAV
jgi:outer membrane protein assembly factor BamB